MSLPLRLTQATDDRGPGSGARADEEAQQTGPVALRARAARGVPPGVLSADRRPVAGVELAELLTEQCRPGLKPWPEPAWSGMRPGGPA